MTPQTIIPLSTGRVLLVEVPEQSTEHFVNDLVKDQYVLTFYLPEKNHYDTIRLLLGDWQLVGTTPLTEEQAARVVEKVRADYICYKDYEHNGYDYPFASQAFASLLTSHNLPTDKRMVVLFEPKKQKPCSE